MMYLKRGGKVIGPFSDEKIRDGLRSGQLRKEDLVSASPSGPWKPLGSIVSSKRVERPQSSTSADDREPSELWILCKDVWKGIASRRKELQDERKADKADAKQVSRQTNGLISPTLAYVLIGALGVGAVVYFGVPGVGGTSSSKSTLEDGSASSSKSTLEQAFIDQVLEPIKSRIEKKPTFIREYRSKFTGGPHVGKAFVDWSKKKYEADLSYNIQKTNSIVSPYVAQINLTLREYSEGSNPSDPLGLGDHRTRESVIAADWREDVVDANTRDANPYTYAYTNGQWNFVPTDYQRRWFGDEQPAPWPILDRRLSEEIGSDWQRLSQ